jgi:hypothetical protein
VLRLASTSPKEMAWVEATFRAGLEAQDITKNRESNIANLIYGLIGSKIKIFK